MLKLIFIYSSKYVIIYNIYYFICLVALVKSINICKCFFQPRQPWLWFPWPTTGVPEKGGQDPVSIFRGALSPTSILQYLMLYYIMGSWQSPSRALEHCTCSGRIQIDKLNHLGVCRDSTLFQYLPTRSGQQTLLAVANFATIGALYMYVLYCSTTPASKRIFDVLKDVLQFFELYVRILLELFVTLVQIVLPKKQKDVSGEIVLVRALHVQK